VDAAAAHRTEVTAAGAAPAVFRILEWDGRPNGDLLCLLMDERGGRQSMRSDERGLVAFEPTGETSTLVVARRAAPPHRVAVSLTPGEQELRLPRGAELSGRVLVGGLPPVRPLRLVAYQAASRNVPATWNEADLERLLQSDHAPAETWTAEDGSFCFVGLTSDWRGNLRLPRGYVEAGTLLTLSPYERRESFYPEPTTGILLELERFPSLAGRLLDPSGAPAVGGFAEANVTWTNGTGMFNGAQCDAQGRFEIFVDDEVRAVTLRCWQGPGRRGEVEYAFGPGELPADGELGDLTLGASRTVELRVVDAEGQPIVGAHTTLDSEPTDAAGVTLLAGVGESTESFDVAARGFLGARVALPANASELTARLVRTNELSITVLGRDGEPLADKGLELLSTRPLFVLRDLGFVARPGTQAQALHEGTWVFSASRAGDVRAAAATDDQGRLSAGGLRTDEPFVLRVRSAGGRLLCESEQEPLGAEEERGVVLRVSERLYTFRGTVFDEQSRPLPDASVALSTELETEVGSSRRSDADGRFTIRWIVAPRGDLTISRDGYLPLTLTDLDFSDAADEARYTLRRGHAVTVRVIDAAGLELPQGSVCADSADGTSGSWVGTPVGAARYQLVGLPDQPIAVHLRLAGADYREIHDPREPELTFVVPVHGAVDLSWDGADETAWRDWISVRLVPLAGEHTELSHEAIDTPRGNHVFPLVLPGEYEVFVVRDGEVDEELTPHVRVHVEPGQTARVQLP